uniref:Uncharacterized protein n=1 Tax=Sinocyclocheilus anshuiensis TaxID=1608454 RepID=A0A671RC39_9TELE
LTTSSATLYFLFSSEAIVLHTTMRVVPMLDQLRKGLQLYDLRKVMEMHPDLCLPLFVTGGKDDKVNHCGSYGNCHPVFSDKGSAKYTKEVNVMNFFQDFLQEVEDCGEAKQMTAGKVMQWMTGQRHKPILPSDQKDFNITVKFNHDSDTNHAVCFPTVSAYTRTITFPTAHLKTLN